MERRANIRAATAMGKSISYKKPSFLHKDFSFLTVWRWNPHDPSTPRKKRLRFQPGSYFAYSVFDFLSERKEYHPLVENGHNHLLAREFEKLRLEKLKLKRDLHDEQY